MPDVLIVGGGLAGLALAAALAPHADVVVLEQGEDLGAEASSQNAGMVRCLGEDPVERSLAWRTDQLLAERDPTVSRVVGAVLALVHEPFHLHDGVAFVRAQGGVVESVDRPEEVAPVLAGSLGIRQAWYRPDARVADPHALLAGFLAELRHRGALVHRNTAVGGLVVRGGRCVGVYTEAGEVEAPVVVLAAGAWSAALAATAGLSRPLFPMRRSLLQSEAHPLSRPDHPWTWLDDVGVYVRPEAGGWLASPCDEVLDWPAAGPGSRGPLTELQRALLQDKVSAHLPALAGLRFPRGWSGLRTFAPDRSPVLGPDPELPGLHWAAGLGGYGVSCCLGVGEAVAAWVRGEQVPWLDPAEVSPARPHLSRWLVRPEGRLHRPKLISGRLPGSS